MGANGTTVAEDMILQTTGCHLHTVLAVSVESVKLQLALNHFSDVITVGSGTCTSTVDVGGQVMELLAVLVGNNRASCGPSISSESDTSIEDNTANGGTGLGVALLMLRVSLGSQSCIADAIIVVKATKGDLLQIVQLNHYYRAFLFYDYFL